MTASSPLVTIAIPTYNRARSYLPQALACAVGQTYQRLEIIVSDNCSTDETPEFMANQSDARIRYFRHEKAMMPNDNFNFCLQQACGEYLLLLLDDELVDVEFVEKCVQAADFRGDIGIVRTGLRVIDANGNPLYEIPNYAAGLDLPDLFLAWFSGKTSFYLCNTLFNTSRLRKIGGLRSRHNLFQDVMAQIRILAESERADIRDVLASTRSHPGQFTYSATVFGWAEDAHDLLELMTLLVTDKRELVRERGLRFFATICYSRAGMIQSLWERLRAYRRLHALFQYSCLPSVRLIASSTTVYRALRTIKRRVKRHPTWTAAG